MSKPFPNQKIAISFSEIAWHTLLSQLAKLGFNLLGKGGWVIIPNPKIKKVAKDIKCISFDGFFAHKLNEGSGDIRMLGGEMKIGNK
ncbi:Uncharacterised protein [Vibrio cholerae]|nr:Uncharacterised protein [Vibrio cholerae]CSI92441.1 Uncharacterised protein [Vibrio cholerae]